MKPNLENLKEYTTRVSLTSEEKLELFNNLRTYSNTHGVQSPFNIFARQSFVYASMFALLIGTGATSFAAENSLPGDILYPIKTNVNEEVVKTLAFSDTKKAKFTISRIDKRMSELEKMIVQEVDSPEKIDAVVMKLGEHKEDLQEFTDNIQITDQEELEEITEIYATLDSVIETHIDILEEIEENSEMFALADIPKTLVTGTITEQPVEDSNSTSTNVVLTMKVADPETSGQIATTDISTSTSTEVTGEEDAINEILNFSTNIDPLITSIRSKSAITDEATSTQIKSTIRKRITEKAEEELNIEIEEETTINIETTIKTAE